MAELVALTGATGFIGSSLLSSLVNSGRKVRALCRRTRTNGARTEWITGDLHSPRALSELVDGAEIIIHCAGTVRGKSEQEFLSINNEGTANLLSACKEKSQQRRFLLISSLAAREPDLSWYARSKSMAEQTLNLHGENMTRTVFRPTAVYGPGDREIRPLLRAMKAGLLPFPNIETKISLLHINDLISAIFTWINLSSTLDGVYELDDGAANGYNWDAMAALAREHWQRSVLKVPVPVRLLNMIAITNLGLARLLHYSPMLTPGKIREIVHPDWTCNNSAISSYLGWQPTIQLSDAMKNPSLLQL